MEVLTREHHAGFPLSFIDTYQDAVTYASPTCLNQSSKFSKCCSQFGANVLYQFGHTSVQYWAFKIGVASSSRSIAISAKQGSTIISALEIDPLSSNVQASVGMTGFATLSNMPLLNPTLSASRQLLFLNANNPFEQGIKSRHAPKWVPTSLHA